jgi:hypothetical protein
MSLNRTFSSLKGAPPFEKYVAFLSLFLVDRSKFDNLFVKYIYLPGKAPVMLIRRRELEWLLRL